MEEPETPTAPSPYANPMVRPDDKRRHRAPPHVPTDESRDMARTLGRVCTVEMAAAKMGISVTTLYRHYKQDLLIGRADATAVIGSKVIKQAMDGDRRSQALFLNGPGGWSQKTVEITGPGGGPVQTFSVDDVREKLKAMSHDERQLLARAAGDLNRLLGPRDIGDDLGEPVGIS